MSPPPLSLGKKIVFSLLPCFVLFFTLEIILRSAGFYYSTTPLFIGLPELIPAQYDVFRKDKWLLWAPNPACPSINSHGFQGEEIDITKPGDTIRVACLGDSCTMCGEVTYPQYLERLLGEKIGGFDVEVINAGCGSYSSLQGMRLLETKVRRFKPDYISVFFGWNDHWLALHQEDKDIKIQSDWVIGIKRLLDKSRAYQLLVKGTLFLRDELGAGDRGQKFRVSPDDYAANLIRMVNSARSIGATPILVTAPTNLNPGNPSLYRLCEFGFFPQPALFNEVHARYNDTVRRVAGNQKVSLLDLEGLLSESDNRDEYLMKDGIHFTDKGRSFVARKLSEIILSDYRLKVPPGKTSPPYTFPTGAR